jgi:hypothetical protein|tara:strand:- start:12608 stop:12997 length:390 start_codon:yes stop_codon:yes gene_type:complete
MADKKKEMGRPKYKANEEHRKTVAVMIAAGIPQKSIGRCLGLDVKTMRKYYAIEMDNSADIANAKVAESLFKQATQGNTAAGIWWTKSRMGWKETREQRIELTNHVELTERINEGRARVAKLKLVANNE